MSESDKQKEAASARERAFGFTRTGTVRHAIRFVAGGSGWSLCGRWCAKSGDYFDPAHPQACLTCSKMESTHERT